MLLVLAGLRGLVGKLLLVAVNWLLPVLGPSLRVSTGVQLLAAPLRPTAAVSATGTRAAASSAPTYLASPGFHRCGTQQQRSHHNQTLHRKELAHGRLLPSCRLTMGGPHTRQ